MDDGFSQYYVRTALSDEVGIKIPNNAEIIKVKFKRVFDISKYTVIYLENDYSNSSYNTKKGESKEVLIINY